MLTLLPAQAAYGFHTLRESHSWAASSRLANQAWYSWYSCTSGWFCGAQPLTNKMRLRVRDDPGSEWREVAVPRSVRALVLLNIQVGAAAGSLDPCNDYCPA
jgi:diacylglycerol kinase (ATP)